MREGSVDLTDDEVDEVPEGFAGGDCRGETGAAENHAEGVELAAAQGTDGFAGSEGMMAEVAAFHDDFHEAGGVDCGGAALSRGRQKGGVGAEVADAEGVEELYPAGDAEGAACLLEFYGVVAAMEGVGGADVVADVAQANAGAEDMAHDMDRNEQQLEQGCGRGQAGAEVDLTVAALYGEALETACLEGAGYVDETAVELDDEAAEGERDASVGVGTEVGGHGADYVDGVAELITPEPEVDVAAFAEFGRGVEAGYGESFLNHGAQAFGAEHAYETADGVGHSMVECLDGVDAGYPAGEECAGRKQTVGELAVGFVADAAHGLAPGQGVDALPVVGRKRAEKLLARGAAGDTAAYELEKRFACGRAARHIGLHEVNVVNTSVVRLR